MKNKTNSLRALVVDDNDNFRAGYTEYLNYQADIEVVGEARDGLEAIRLIEKLKPDIVFMDISMPGMDGLAAASIIKEKYPEVKIVIVSIHQKSIVKEVAASLPIDGYVSKSSLLIELPRMLKKLDINSNAAN